MKIIIKKYVDPSHFDEGEYENEEDTVYAGDELSYHIGGAADEDNSVYIEVDNRDDIRMEHIGIPDFDKHFRNALECVFRATEFTTRDEIRTYLNNHGLTELEDYPG